MKSGIVRATILGFLAVFVGVGSAGASTITVDFYTTGVFCGAADTTAACQASTTTSLSLSGGGGSTGTLSFSGVGSVGTPVSLSNPDGGSTGVSLGTFDSYRTGTSEMGLSAYKFLLMIYQSVPSSGSGTLIGTITGGLKNNGQVAFSPGSFVLIGNVTYDLTSDILALTDESGTTAHTLRNLTATITHTDVAPIPEPASMFLLGTGLVGVGAAVRRRRRAEKNA